MHNPLRHGVKLFQRASRIAFAFLVMNGAAVAALVVVAARRKVWR